MLNTNRTSQKDASAMCNSLGGNLVAWSTYAEQLEVEQHYIKQGFLMPVFHKNYWMGLRATNHPSFKWMDPWAKGPNPSTYQHWGSDGSSKEPNNQTPPEFCAVGNFTQRYDNVWGWADTRCSGSYTSMCIIRPLCTVQPPPYTTNVSKATFELVLCNYTWEAAQKACNARAGHLAHYLSSGEQAEAEKYYVDNGYLLPAFHKGYWFGLRTTADTWPSFTWVDKTVKLPLTYRWAGAAGAAGKVVPSPGELGCRRLPGANARAGSICCNVRCRNWGTLRDENGNIFGEPNNRESPPETCGAVNGSLVSKGAFQWADQNCNKGFVAMCRWQGGWQMGSE